MRRKYTNLAYFYKHRLCRCFIVNNMISRRAFLKTGAAAAGSWALPRFAIGQSGKPANSKLNLALIGTGGIAGVAIKAAIGENLVAICDVNEKNLGLHANLNPQMATAARFRDFRVMLDKMGKDIDGVVICTPDHTHFAATMDAMQRGKHVHTQKPLTHNVWQARTLRKAKQKYKVVTNMANQGHTYSGIRQMREWFEAGVMGSVAEVDSWYPGPNWSGPAFRKPTTFPPERMPVPRELDWPLWLGPAEDPGFNTIYEYKTWRGFPRFGSGMIGAIFLATGLSPMRAEGSLESQFENPPDSARPMAFWHWMNGLVGKEGITADLEEKTDLSKDHPDIVQRLSARLDTLKKDAPAPFWKGKVGENKVPKGWKPTPVIGPDQE